MAFTDTLKRKYRQNHILIFIFFLAGTLYIPVTLIWTGVIPFRYRFAVMFLILLVMVSYVRLRKFHWSDLGFRLDTLKRSLMWNLGTSFLFLALLYLLHNAGLIGTAAIRFCLSMMPHWMWITGRGIPAASYWLRIWWAVVNRR